MILCSWIFTIFLAITFFPSERNLEKVALAIIATLAVVTLNIRNHHFELDKYSLMIIGAAFFVGIYNILIKHLLEVFDPFTLYFLRSLAIAPILILFIRPSFNDFKIKRITPIITICILYILENLFIFWSYNLHGIVYTSLLMTTAPIVTLWGSKIFLNESLHIKNIVATIVIIACISLSLIV